MTMFIRLRVALCLLVLGTACTTSRGPVMTPPVLAGLSEPKDPPLNLGDDDDRERARAIFLATASHDASRAAERHQLFAAYQSGIDKALLGGEGEHAFALFQSSLEMWSAEELADSTRAAPGLDMVVPTAQAILDHFSKRGGGLESVTALAVLIAAVPERAAEYQKRFAEIVGYLDDLSVADSGPGAERSATIRFLQGVVFRFPSPWPAKTLVDLYLARQAAIQDAIQKGTKLSGLGANEEGILRPVANIIAAFAHVSRLADALPIVERLAGQFGDQPELRRRLADALAPGATGIAWLALAGPFFPEMDDPDALAKLTTARRICEIGAHAQPRAPEPRICAGETAMKSDLLPVAIGWLEDALTLDPKNADVRSYLARLYLGRLADLIATERLDAALAELGHITRYYDQARKDFPGTPIEPPLAYAFLTMGRGLYNVGEISRASTYLAKANEVSPSPQAVEQLALIALKTGRYDQAAHDFARAAAMPRGNPLEEQFDRTRLARLQGEALALQGRANEAHAEWIRAVESWATVLHSPITPTARAQVHMERARLLFNLGQSDQARQAFEQAVDAAPEHSEVYADAVAFFMTRGFFEPALDAYHRALGRKEITEYFKVYSTLWVLDFARIRGLEPDPLALDYLASVHGDQWYHHLATFALGKITFEELVAKADTRGKRAEAYFYAALERYAQKDRKGAEELLRQVIATDMLGFFEYDMATFFLRNGPPQ